jgi:hypothetical protein
MNTKGLRCLLLVVLIFLVCLVVACTTDQLATKEKKPKEPMTAEERSRREMESRVLESTWYEGSDYHRGRDDSGAIDAGEWMRTKKEMKAKQEETEKRLAKLEKQTGKQQAPEPQAQGAGSQSTAAVAAPVAAASKGAKVQQSLRPTVWALSQQPWWLRLLQPPIREPKSSRVFVSKWQSFSCRKRIDPVRR